MMKLYGYWRSSAAYRVRIALNLKGLSCEHHAVHLVKDGGQQHQTEYLALNPQALVPVLVDDELVLTQSLAILEYLEERYPEPALLPADIQRRARVRALANLIACDVHPLNNLRVLQYLTHDMSQDTDARDHWYRHWITKGLTAFEMLLQQEQARRDSPFCDGESPTIADICLVPQVYNAKRFNVPLDDFPHIVRISQHCNRLAAFQDAAPERQADAVAT